jgi:D-aspartate ligase
MRKPFSRSDAVLLTNADYYGALAAVRSLGRYGAPVVVAHDSRMGAASWSRYVTRRLRCPPTHDSQAFLRWLLDFGERSPGHVLYPASDDAAFIYAAHREELSRKFRLYQPPFEAVYALLNKRRLYLESRAAGLQTPNTWFPESEADFDQIRRETNLPLMIKPVTQILFARHRKGEFVANADALFERYGSFAAEPYAGELLERDPEVIRPMVQEFHAEAGQAIYSLSGFINEQGDWAMRGATKVLQLPRNLGVGICFEEAVVEPRLVEGVVSLCQRVGYYGVFEAEFIRSGEGRLLIDFNPRFFGQMGFDMARGLPLVVLAYEAALGHVEQVGRLLRAANDWPSNKAVAPVYCHKMALDILLSTQRVSGAMPAAQARDWRSWWRDHLAVDAVLDDDDWAPAAVDFVNRLSGYAKHPRSFLRSVVLNQ